MSTFRIYLELGFDHIIDIQGYDHMLFIVTLCAVYALKDWKKVLVLVTAFTIGHSVTLALSAFDIFALNTDLVELLIPITILLTAIHNIVWFKGSGTTFKKADWMHYSLAMGFGFIHGMGFSNYLKALLGSEEDIVLPLFSFNVGLEIGQVCIVALFFSFYAIFTKLVSVKRRNWTIGISGAAAIIALVMIVERI